MVKYRDYSNNKEFAVQFGLNRGLDKICAVYPEEGFTDEDFNSTVCFLAKKYTLPIFRSIDGMLYMSALGEMKRIPSDHVIVFIMPVLKNVERIYRYTKKSFDSMKWSKEYYECNESGIVSSADANNHDYPSKLRQIGERKGFTLDKVLSISFDIPCIDIDNFDFKTYIGEYVIINNYKDSGCIKRKVFICTNKQYVFTSTSENQINQEIASCQYIEADNRFSEWILRLV